MEGNTELPVNLQKRNIYKTLFFLLLYLILLVAVAGAAYWLGRQEKTGQSNQVAQITQTPDQTETPPDPEGSDLPEESVKDMDFVEIGPDTVSYARLGDKVYLRYRDKIYDDSNPMYPQEIKLKLSQPLIWHGLVNAPAGVTPGAFMYDELFSFKQSPDKKSFALVMRWMVEKPEIQPEEFNIYYYNPYLGFSHSLLVEKFPNLERKGVPQIDQFDASGNYLAFKIFGCWNCGGHTPTTLLLRIEPQYEFKEIGRTSYFNWLEDGKYEYKDYVEKDCEGEVMGPCSEEPESLPLKTGQF